jgi:hypothetical protein
MRRQGARPNVVFLDVDRDHTEQWRRWPQLSPHRPTVQVEPTDSPARLDLRFVIGLIVLVSGSDADRVQRIGKACEDAEALRVITTVCDPKTCEVVDFSDTEDPLWPTS